jgi:hypothetical protein
MAKAYYTPQRSNYSEAILNEEQTQKQCTELWLSMHDAFVGHNARNSDHKSLPRNLAWINPAPIMGKKEVMKRAFYRQHIILPYFMIRPVIEHSPRISKEKNDNMTESKESKEQL